jgi:hypothetical protein
MAECNFNIPFNIPAFEIIAKAKSAIENQKGMFNGDERSGDFQVSVIGNNIKGNYTITGQVMSLVITQKPFFVPCSTIENLLLKEISK